MRYRSDQLVASLVRMYGEDFLRYIFAAPAPDNLESVVSGRLAFANDLLSLSLVSMQSGDDAMDMGFTVAGRLTCYGNYSIEDAYNILDPWGVEKNQPLWVPRQVPIYQGSLVNFVRLKHGGVVYQPKRLSDDTIARCIQRMAVDVWPMYLLRTRSSMMPLSMVMRTHHGIEYSPAFSELTESIIEDNVFGKVFERVSSDEIGDNLATKTYVTNCGNMTSMRLSEFVNAVLFHTTVKLSGDLVDVDRFFDSIEESVCDMRRLMGGRSVRVPALTYYAGMRLEDQSEVQLEGGILRNASDFERDVLLGGGLPRNNGMVMESSYDLRVVEFCGSSDLGAGSSRKLEGSAVMYENEIRELNGRSRKLELSILLSSQFMPEMKISAPTTYYIANILNMTSPHSINVGHVADEMYGQVVISEVRAANVARMHSFIESRHEKKMDIAVDQLTQAAFLSRSSSDGFISAAIAWEAMLSISPCTKARIVDATIKLIGRQCGDLDVLKDELLSLYDDRSGLVHGSLRFTPEEIEHKRQRMIEVCVQVMRVMYVERNDLLNLSARKRTQRLLNLSNRMAKRNSC